MVGVDTAERIGGPPTAERKLDSVRPAVSRKCIITGDGMHTAMVRQGASI